MKHMSLYRKVSIALALVAPITLIAFWATAHQKLTFISLCLALIAAAFVWKDKDRRTEGK